MLGIKFLLLAICLAIVSCSLSLYHIARYFMRIGSKLSDLD